jgi:methylase of polypeptide subunit release factors
MYFTVQDGVFIPRWETAEWATALAFRLRRLRDAQKKFVSVDFCTGTGCIPIFLKMALQEQYGFFDKNSFDQGKIDPATFIGIDINPKAIGVAQYNRSIYGDGIQYVLTCNLLTRQ